MEPIKRKRVTRVGSGAFSIYLPKKWIDSWAPDPDADRQVDLHVINDALMIVPANLERTLERTIAPEPSLIATLLLSAYVRGLDGCTLHPESGAFGNDAITASRDLLRHLDERMVATCTPETIAFRLNPDLPPPAALGQDILRTMGSKVREMLGLAAEAVDNFASDPDRALHAMRLLDVTQREDVQRLLYQAVRSVARIELPMDSVSDFQFLDLIASHLERVGGHMVRMVETILMEYGLERKDLEYPRDHLLKQIGERAPLQGPGRDMVVGFRRDFAELDDLTQRVVAGLQTNDPAAMAAAANEATELQLRVGKRVFAAVAEHWGTDTNESDARTAFAMSKIASLIADVLHALQNVARHATMLTAAAEP